MAYMERFPSSPAQQCGLIQYTLQQWLHDEGRELLVAERARLYDCMPEICGENAVQIGLTQISWLPQNTRLHCTRLEINGESEQSHAPQRLTLGDDSADIAIMPHVLESVVQPALMLREVVRVLVPGGTVLLFTIVPGWSGPSLPPFLYARSIRYARLQQQLRWLDCVVLCHRPVHVKLPLRWLPPRFSGARVCFIHAQHRAPGVTPLPQRKRFRDKASPSLSTAGIPVNRQ